MPVKVRSQYKADEGKLHEEERDNAKYWSKGKVKIALLGLENQTKPDQDMPFRVIGYDGAAYRSQLIDEKSKERCPVLSISFTSENPTGTARGRFWRWWIFRKAWKTM